MTTKYSVMTSERVYVEYFVEAESEEEAVEKVRSGDLSLKYEEMDVTHDFAIENVEVTE